PHEGLRRNQKEQHLPRLLRSWPHGLHRPALRRQVPRRPGEIREILLTQVAQASWPAFFIVGQAFFACPFGAPYAPSLIPPHRRHRTRRPHLPSPPPLLPHHTSRRPPHRRRLPQPLGRTALPGHLGPRHPTNLRHGCRLVETRRPRIHARHHTRRAPPHP